MRAGKQEGYAETNERGVSWTFASLPLTKDHYRMEGRTEMHNSQDLQKVLEIRDAILGGNEKRLKEQREAGKLTARERVEKLADAGSFVELFALVSQNEEGAGVITGYATIEERPVYLTAFSDENTSLEAAFASGSGPVACSVASLVHDPRASAADRSSRLHKVVVLVIIL